MPGSPVARRLVSSLAAILLPTHALADSATHEFRIVSARTASRADCGSGVCRPACQMKATLTNTGGRAFPGLALVFAPDREGASSLSFRFPDLLPGETAEAGRFQDGVACGRIAAGRVRAECLGDPSACLPGASVRVLGAGVPEIEPRTVETDAPRRAADAAENALR